MRTVSATRYVTPLRQGGSMPAIVEADDEGMYVLKFRGAAQGPKVLIAELLAGELARAIGLPVPEIVFIELDADLARSEPDPEIQELIQRSVGLNIALDYLPGSAMFDPVVRPPDAKLAAAVVWFDAFVSNVDRTARNTNMLMWHRKLWLIDHGAALYFHHSWERHMERSTDPFTLIKDHVLLPFAGSIAHADSTLSALITAQLVQELVAIIPDEWLAADAPFESNAQHRDAYLQYLLRRLDPPRAFAEEAIRARTLV